MKDLTAYKRQGLPSSRDGLLVSTEPGILPSHILGCGTVCLPPDGIRIHFDPIWTTRPANVSTIPPMASESDKRDLDSLTILIDQADSKPPADPEGISQRLAEAHGRPDLGPAFQQAIRKTVSGRLVNAELRSPKVAFVVMDNGIAVLAGIGSTGVMRKYPTETDMTAHWPDIRNIHFQFPEWLGGLGITSTNRIETSTGPFEIIIATSSGGVSRIVPDDNVLDFAGAARKAAALLDSPVRPVAADLTSTPETHNERFRLEACRRLGHPATFRWY